MKDPMRVSEEEIKLLIQATEETTGADRAVKFSFGPTGVFIDAHEQPDKAAIVREFREEATGVLVSDGAGI